MKITLLNHAGILLEYRGLRLVCDPWLEGNIYANSMGLLAPSVFDYQEFKTVNYIWFSGEQLDRFSIPTLQKIPLEYREKITILYYQGFSKQLIRECQELGFLNAIELTADSWVKLSDDFSMLSEAYGEGAWACFNSQEISVLNCSNAPILNNRKGRKVFKKIGSEPEWLLTRHNFNTYVPDFQTDEDSLLEAADESVTTFMEQLELFDPQLVVPLGEFMYYMNEENHNLTHYFNTLSEMITLVNRSAYARVALLFINHALELGKIPETEKALQKWTDIAPKSLDIIENQKVELAELQEKTLKFLTHFRKKTPFWMRQKARKTYLYLLDYEQVFEFHIRKGLRPSIMHPNLCHMALSSEVLADCLAHPERIKMYSQMGRILRIKHKNIYEIYNIFMISYLMNTKKVLSLVQYWCILWKKKLN